MFQTSKQAAAKVLARVLAERASYQLGLVSMPPKNPGTQRSIFTYLVSQTANSTSMIIASDEGHPDVVQVTSM